MQDVIRHIDTEELIRLASNDYPACISIFLSLELAGKDIQKNLTQFKGLCHKAEQKLEHYGTDKELSSLLLAPLKALWRDQGFWKSRDKGLAVLRAPDSLHVFLLPDTFVPLAIVDRRFFIRPFLEKAIPQKMQNILILNPEEIRMINYQNDSVKEIFPPDELRSFRHFISFFDLSEHYQTRYAESAPRSGAAGLPVFQRQGAADGEAPKDRYLDEYYRRVKNWLKHAVPALVQRPLYLVGAEKNIGHFMKAAADLDMKVLMNVNANAFDRNALQERIKDENERLAADGTNKSTEDLRRVEANEPDKVLTDPRRIISAAYAHRIETLFIPASSKNMWGHFDENSQRLILEKQDETVGEELINLSAIKTLEYNGDVVPVPEETVFQEIPSFAAICRW